MFRVSPQDGGCHHNAGRRAAVALLCASTCGLSAAAAARSAPRVTLLEGDSALVDGRGAIVVEGARAGAVVIGLALKAQTLVETPPGTGLLRIEFPDGSIADLGPQTRVMLEPAGLAPRAGKPPLLYLLSGWLKLASPTAAATAGLTLPELELPPFSGTVIVQAAQQLQRVFVEAGHAEVVERRSGGSRSALANGQLYSAGVGVAGGVLARPPADFLAGLPRLFRDRIPSQAARLKDTTAEATPLPAPSYTALRPWLLAEPAIRRDFPRRFAELARAAPFRRGLEAGLAQHPEWKPVLYPPQPPRPPT